MKTVISSILLLLLSCSTISPSLASPVPDQEDTETPTIKTRRLLLRGGNHQQKHDEQQERHLLNGSPEETSPPPPYCVGHTQTEYDGTGVVAPFRIYSTPTFFKNIRATEYDTVGMSVITGEEGEKWVLLSVNNDGAAPYMFRNLYHGYYLQAQPNKEVTVACADSSPGLEWDFVMDNNTGYRKILSTIEGTYLQPREDDSIHLTENDNNFPWALKWYLP